MRKEVFFGGGGGDITFVEVLITKAKSSKKMPKGDVHGSNFLGAVVQNVSFFSYFFFLLRRGKGKGAKKREQREDGKREKRREWTSWVHQPYHNSNRRAKFACKDL